MPFAILKVSAYFTASALTIFFIFPEWSQTVYPKSLIWFSTTNGDCLKFVTTPLSICAYLLSAPLLPLISPSVPISRLCILCPPIIAFFIDCLSASMVFPVSESSILNPILSLPRYNTAIICIFIILTSDTIH